MKSVVIIILGCCWSTVLTKESTSTTDVCADFNKEHVYAPCYLLKRLSYQEKDPNECGQKIIESKKRIQPKRQGAFYKLAYEYCFLDGVRNNHCNRCFERFFKLHWDQPFCLDIGLAINKVRDCLHNYRHMQQYWDHDFKFNVYTYEVDLNVYAHGRCRNEFTKDVLTTDNKINFPVRLKGQSDEYETYINLVLSLFMKAFLHNKSFRPDYVGCQDLVDSGYLQIYKQLTSVMIKAPDEVKEIYLKLRISMCSDSANPKTCEKCFQFADERFLYHLYNKDTANSVRKDFQNINQMYTNCIENDIGEKYSSLKISTNNYKNASWPGFSTDCMDYKTVHYQALITAAVEPLNVTDGDVNFVKGVLTNYMAFNIYQKSQVNGAQQACADMKESRTVCAAAVTKQTIFLLKYDKDYMDYNPDQRLELFSSNIQSCDKDTFVTS